MSDIDSPNKLEVEHLATSICFEKAMQGLSGANQDAIANFKTYVERRVAANRDFVEKLLRAKDFQEAFRIQVEHFQCQLKVVEDAS